MKVKQIHIEGEKSSSSVLADIKGFEADLIIVFGSLKYFKESDLLKSISKLEGSTQVIGCSTAGEITKDGVFDDSITLSLVKFEKGTHVKTHLSEFTENEGAAKCGNNLSKEIDHENLKFILAFGPGVNFNGSDFIRGIKENIPSNTILTGGLAADGGQFTQTFLISNNTISDKHAGAVCFYGDNVEVGFGSMGGWEPFGPARKITKCEGNILYEIDGKPALDIYKEYLGEKAEGLPGTGLLYPLSMLDNSQAETGVIRTILGVNEDDKSMVLAGELNSDSLVKLMQARSSNLVKGSGLAAENCLNIIPSGINGDQLGVLISCVGRKLVLEDEVDEEVESVAKIFKDTVLTGYYSNGEICPHDNEIQDCRLHNQTMTITLFGEK